MPVPEELVKLITEKQEKLQLDPEHNLAATDRADIYSAFGSWRYTQREVLASNIEILAEANQMPFVTIGDYALSWLAVLTAEKVLGVWEAAKPQSLLRPDKLVTTAKTILLTGEIPFATPGPFAAESVKTEATYPVMAAFDTACSAFYLVRGRRGIKELAENYVENATTNRRGDFAHEAMQAWAVIDENAPGQWLAENNKPSINELGLWLTDRRAEEIKGFMPLRTDPRRRKEFWEWWLSEAIPKAWKLAKAAS